MALKLQPDVELIEGYRLVRQIGKGGFGEVWEAKAPGGLSKAVKVSLMDTVNSEISARELQGLEKIRIIRHPFLLSIERYEVMEGHLVIVMELADKSLADRFEECRKEGKQGVPREELLGYMREASEALDLINFQHGLQHLDIKPANLFLSSGHVKVADFGLVHPRNTRISSSALAFSPPYAPPELFDGQVESSADQYSLAITYQELLTGSRPYTAIDVRGLMFQHLKGKPDFSLLPKSDQPVVGQAINRDLAQRFPSCGKFVETLTKAHIVGLPSVNLSNMKPMGVVPTASKPGATNTGSQSMFVRHPTAKVQTTNTQPSRTMAVGSRAAHTAVINPQVTVTQEAGEIKVKETFLAFLPLEIYAHKLRGFVDDLEAEIVSTTEEQTVLLIRQKRGFLGFKSKKGIFVQIDSCSRTPNSGYRAVEVSVWGSGQQLSDQDLAKRGRLVISYLKCFLMASSSQNLRPLDQIRAELRE